MKHFLDGPEQKVITEYPLTGRDCSKIVQGVYEDGWQGASLVKLLWWSVRDLYRYLRRKCWRRGWFTPAGYIVLVAACLGLLWIAGHVR